MKTTTLIEIFLLLTLLPIAGAVQAACVADAPEIGDEGPAGPIVCKDLEHEFPNTNITVYDRNVFSPSDVTVIARVDDKPVSIRYRLDKADWIESPSPCQNGS